MGSKPKQSRSIYPHKRLHPAGRVCAEKGCKTVLSRYNAKSVCSVHEDLTSVPLHRWMK